MKNKFPAYYYLLLLLALFLAVAFWCAIFWNGKSIIISKNFPEGNDLPEITQDRIITDSATKRKILSGVINIALKDTIAASFQNFKRDFNTKYSEVSVAFVDDDIHMMQIEVEESDRHRIKEKLKNDMRPYDLLVWDESLYGVSARSNLSAQKWHLKETNLEQLPSLVSAGNVTIAVIDNGFDISHPSLKGRIVKPYNVYDDSENVSPASENHGTHVSSIAAGSKVGEFSGVCPTCNIMPVKLADPAGNFSGSYVIRAILYAIKNKADVINLSLGTELPPNISEEAMYALKDEEEFWKELFEYAARNRTVCIIAAGNSSTITGIDPFQRSPLTVKVGAVDPNYEVTDFSNRGGLTTLYAPGYLIYGAKPGGSFEALNGTSMAAPVVAGFAAILKSVHPEYSTQQIIDLILQNTEVINGVKQLKYKTL